MRSDQGAAPRAARAMILALALWTFVGCSAPARIPPVTLQAAGNDDASQLEFWHTLADRPLATNDDAFHAILIFANGGDSAADYAGRVAALRARGLLPGAFAGAADEAVERGTLAYALLGTLDLKRGLTLGLFGNSPRYAIRELQFRNLFPPSSPHQFFSGGELLGVLGKAEDFRRGNPADAPAAVLPPTNGAAATASPAPAPRDADPSPAAEQLTLDPLGAALATEPLFASLLPPTAPSTGPATTRGAAPPVPPGKLEIVVTGLDGLVQVRDGEGRPWRRATLGEVVSEGAEFRTGLPGAVRCLVRPNQVASLDRLGTMKFVRAAAEGDAAVLYVGMKYGRTRVDAEAEEIAWPVVRLAADDDTLAAATAAAQDGVITAPPPADPPAPKRPRLRAVTTIVSPGARLALGGTRVSLFDQRPFVPEAVSLTGIASFRNLRGKAVSVGGTRGKAVVSGADDTPAAFALAQAVVDPTLGGGARTASEQQLLDTLISRGAVISLDPGSGLRIVRGGAPPTYPELRRVLPGTLNFAVRWDSNTNFDLAVGGPATPASPGGELVYPAAGLDAVASGGKTAFDHRGGPAGGIEVAYWPATFPAGVYAVAATNLGNKPADAKFRAFLDGHRLEPLPGFQSVRRIEPGASGIVLYQTDAPIFPFDAGRASRESPPRVDPAATTVKPVSRSPLTPGGRRAR